MILNSISCFFLAQYWFLMHNHNKNIHRRYQTLMSTQEQPEMNALFHGDLVESSRILYTPSDFAKESLLYLQEIGKLQARKPHISKRNHLTSYLFFVVLSGTGRLHYQNTNYVLTRGDCIFIDCRNRYYHETSDNLWMLKWIHFNGKNMQNIYEKYRERGGQPVFHLKNLTAFEDVWHKIYLSASSTDYIRDMKVNEGLASLLTLLMQESWHPESTKRHNTKRKSLIQIQAYLDTHYQEQIRLDSLAEQFYINKFYLTKVFKEQFGLSIQNYLLEKRITHAKHLLRFTDNTLENIAMECGMGAPYYFSRMFKKIEGISPSEYRKIW